MFQNKKETQPDKAPDPLNRAEAPGCGPSNVIMWLVLTSVFAIWLWPVIAENWNDTTEISYSTFRQQLKAGNVEQVTVRGEQIQGRLKKPITKEAAKEEEPGPPTDFVTYLPSFGDDRLLPLLEAHGVEIETQPQLDFSWMSALLGLLPIIILVGLGFMFFRQMRVQGQNIFHIGKSRAKRYQEHAEKTTFDDVAGVRGAKTELQEIVAFLKDPTQVQRLGGEAPTGILLIGPPGTGKTLLARAVAGEANVPFFSITGSDFMEMFVGVGASRVRDLFAEAKKAAPSIIFIDELDSIGRRRGAGLGGGHDEREQTLNQLLSELDGFEPNQNVIVMAATNRPDILDRALLRPGRFDRQITVDLPTTQNRLEILKIHALNKPLAADVDLAQIARGTPGFSGADLRNILNEAALMAARKDKDVIELADMEEARDKILMGLEREGVVLTEEECQLIAYHEAGHAVIAAILPYADPIHKVTIVPRGRAMGATQQLPEREKYIVPRQYMLDRLAVMMGGRAAEDLAFQTITSGAENDLKQATQLVRKMVLDWGMSNQLGHVAWGGEREQVFLGEEIAHRRDYSEATAHEIDEEVKTILEEAYERAIKTLRAHRPELDRVAEALLKKEEIMGDEVLKIVGVAKERISLLSINGRVQEESAES